MNPLRIITTGTGVFKPGLTGTIVAGSEREIFIGLSGQETKHTIPEFTVLIDGQKHPRQFCQYGRDFVFQSCKLEKS